MKQITIAGNCGRDAVTRHTQAGDAVTSWSVAVEDRQGSEKRTLWFDVSLWGKRGETLAQYLTKGSKVAVSGDFGTREHEGKTYLTLRADQVTLLGGGESQGRQRDTDAPQRDKGGAPAGGRGSDIDDDLPFAPEWR